MNTTEFRNLQLGDILRNKGSGTAYLVISTTPVVVARTYTVDNPDEWELVAVVKHLE